MIVVYTAEPTFPATDQHPSAVRYKVGKFWVDAIGGEPTPDEVVAIMSPPQRRQISKSVILSRITDQQLDAALAAMTNRQKERWRSPDVQLVFADDPEIVALVTAIGADPAVVLAPAPAVILAP